ncbi:uncharacterized protein G2W53_003721 [Senna tora]|uniref:Uncharacterized protein n=1 Tax=Senna tora TaxID=362788 RepID=A0A834XE20_9FABA|nr:uncharacterized protein G2W53_003721 [Senna tora]
MEERLEMDRKNKKITYEKEDLLMHKKTKIEGLIEI